MFQAFKNKLETAIQNESSFVLYRKPNEDFLHLNVQDHSDQNRFVFHSFDSKLEKVISDAFPVFISSNEFEFESNLNLKTTEEFLPKSELDYRNLIEFTVKSIQESDLKKVVMSRKKTIPNSSYSIFKSFRNLLQTHPSALVFLWYSPQEETWMGATPELLLSQEGNTVKTVSLAGTKLPEANWTDKEMEEQQIVTDFIVSNFSGLHNLQVEGPETVQAGKFQHLKSYISAEIPENYALENLLEKMHPTPALCGMPKKDAFDFILQNEGYEREFYSGYLGIEKEFSKKYYVNLRSAQIFQNEIWLYVGGGITADSDPEKEWKETELKSSTILNSLEK